MRYVIKIENQPFDTYLMHGRYKWTNDIYKADIFESEQEAFNEYLEIWAFPGDHLDEIKNKEIVVVELGQLNLF